MGLYDAARTLLVDEGPLENLYLFRLPAEQTAPVDVAHVPLSGVGAQRYLGSSLVVGGPMGVSHDGGVLWYHTGVQFQVRGEDPGDPEAVMDLADAVRDVLIQYAGTSVVKSGEEIVRCEIGTAPTYFGQDEQERPIAALTIEVWHRPTDSGDSVPVVPVDPTDLMALQWGGTDIEWTDPLFWGS